MDRDGYLFFIPPLILSALFYLLFLYAGSIILLYTAFILFIVSQFMIFFFRDPERKIPHGENIIVSPVDGKVLKVGTGDSGEKNLSIFLSLFNVHVNRVPVSGKVVDIRKRPGIFRAAYKPEAEKINAAIETDISTPYGLVTVRQVVGILARRLVNRLKIGDEVRSGQRFGLMRFGSRLDLFLPSGAELEISEGKRVKGGSTILGEFKDA